MKKIIFLISILILALVIIFHKPLIRLFFDMTDPACKLSNAWKSGNRIYFKEYVDEIEGQEFPEIAWSSTLLSEETNVSFGEFNRKEDWSKVNLSQKVIAKKNIFIFWKLYLESELFLNKERDMNMNMFYVDSHIYTKEEIKKIKCVLNAAAHGEIDYKFWYGEDFDSCWSRLSDLKICNDAK